jgi:hypothetical protein
VCKAHARAGETWCMPRGEPSAGRPVARHAVHGSRGAWALWGVSGSPRAAMALTTRGGGGKVSQYERYRYGATRIVPQHAGFP